MIPNVVAPKIVMDTSVLVSALRSQRGASYRLLSLMDSGRYELSVSVALMLEYESVGKHVAPEVGLTPEDIDDILDYMCAVATHQLVFYLWRPALPDAGDDMVLEVAVSAGCGYLVTHNVRHFETGAAAFGITVVSPGEFLRVIGESA